MAEIQRVFATPQPSPLVDPFERKVTYLRVSVTDRCDFRCTYCMSEDMTFQPRKDLLTLAELERLCVAFIDKGEQDSTDRRRTSGAAEYHASGPRTWRPGEIR